MKTIWQLKEQIEKRLKQVEASGTIKKADWIEWLTELASSAEDLENIVHEDCYSSDQIREFADEAIEEHEREKYRLLNNRSPEEHRSRFNALNGGAA